MTRSECEALYYATGWQDCGNTFDGDDVPSVDDLRDGWEYGHADSLADDTLPYADAARDAWIRGWRDCAEGYVREWRAKDAARRAAEEAEGAADA